MQRLLVNDAGDCFARFKDGTTLFLSSSCHFVVETAGADNKQSSHLIDFINATLQQRVEQVIHIRNRYVSPIRIPTFMRKNSKASKVSMTPAAEPTWTQQCQRNIRNQTITSQDGCTTLALHRNGQQFTVTFLETLRKEVQVTNCGDTLQLYHHQQMTQIHSTRNHDQRWTFPLRLLRGHEALTPISARLTPTQPSESLQTSMAKLSAKMLEAISYFHCSPRGYPPAQLVVVEWTPQRVHRVFNAPQFSVESFVAADESYLLCDAERQFLHHYVGDKEFVYSAKAIPPIAPSAKQEASYDLRGAAESALALLSNAVAANRERRQQTPEEKTTKKRPMSHRVKQTHVDPRVGEFTCYDDGRVKVRFSDRTLLELNADAMTCAIITRFGEQLTRVDCRRPATVFVKYIQHALNFAQWCSLSTTQQLQHKHDTLQARSDIQRQMNFSQRVLQTHKLEALTAIDAYSSAISSSNSSQSVLVQSIQAQMDDIDRLLR